MQSTGSISSVVFYCRQFAALFNSEPLMFTKSHPAKLTRSRRWSYIQHHEVHQLADFCMAMNSMGVAGLQYEGSLPFKPDGTQMQAQTQTQRHKDTETQSSQSSHRDTETQRHGHTGHTDTEKHRNTQRETETQAERERSRDMQIHAQTHTHTHT